MTNHQSGILSLANLVRQMPYQNYLKLSYEHPFQPTPSLLAMFIVILNTNTNRKC